MTVFLTLTRMIPTVANPGRNSENSTHKQKVRYSFFKSLEKFVLKLFWYRVATFCDLSSYPSVLPKHDRLSSRKRWELRGIASLRYWRQYLPVPPNRCIFPVKLIRYTFLLWSIHQRSFSSESSFLWERLLVYSSLYCIRFCIISPNAPKICRVSCN